MSSTKGIHRPGEVLTGNTTFYTAYSLVDITDTGDSDPKGNTVSFQQAQNLNSLIQALSLRTQLVLSSITSSDVDLSDYEFGSLFTGTHKVWVFKFASEAQDVFAKREDKNIKLNDVLAQLNINSVKTQEELDGEIPKA